MSSYVLNLADGAVIEILADSDQQAIAIARRRLRAIMGACPVAASQWDADGRNDDGLPMRRILFWASEEEAEGDNGAKAVATLTAVGGARA